MKKQRDDVMVRCFHCAMVWWYNIMKEQYCGCWYKEMSWGSVRAMLKWCDGVTMKLYNDLLARWCDVCCIELKLETQNGSCFIWWRWCMMFAHRNATIGSGSAKWHNDAMVCSWNCMNVKLLDTAKSWRCNVMICNYTICNWTMLQCHDDAIAWCCNYMICNYMICNWMMLWWHDAALAWCCIGMVLQWHDDAKAWCCKSMMMQLHDAAIAWCCNCMILQLHGAAIAWCCNCMICNCMMLKLAWC